MTLSHWLAPDRDVPQRDGLLDIAAVQSRLRRHLGRVSLRPVRTKYRIGESLRVVYRVVADGGRETLISTRTRPGRSTEGRASGAPSARRPDSAHFPSTFEDERLGAAFWIFPRDRGLDGLDALLRPAAELRARLGDRWHGTRLVSYVPEKCAVVACTDKEGQPIAYVKKYGSRTAAHRAFALHAAIATQANDAGALRVPEPLFVDSARQVTGVAAAPGIRLADLDRSATSEALRQLGRVVAELHGLSLPDNLPQSRRATTESLSNAASLVGRARPALRSSLTALTAALTAAAPAAGTPVLLHADLHLKNALVHAGRVWLIDLDQASCGDAAADLGSLLAWLRTQATAGLMTVNEAAGFSASFLDGYAEGRPVPPRESVDWHTAAALLEQRVLRAIARIRMPLLPHLDAIVADALSLCPRGGDA